MPRENSVYPSRYGPYEEILSRKLEEAAKAAIQGRSDAGLDDRFPSWTRGLAAIGVIAAVLVFAAGARSDPPSRLSTGPGTLFSAQLAGASASPEEIIPPLAAAMHQQETTETVAAAREEKTPRQLLRDLGDRRRPPIRASVPPVPSPQPTPCAECREMAAPTVVLFDDTGEHGVRVPAVSPTPAPVINVGTRIHAVLPEPVVTSPGGTPVIVLVTDDVVVGDHVALRAGARMVGDAFAIEEDDRVQIIVTAVVVDGKTVPLSGVVVSDENRLGLPAKVVKKRSTGKRGLGRALGVVGSTLSVGLIPGVSSIGSAAASRIAAESASDLNQIEARWTRSDKVLRAPAGAVTVYLRADLVLP